MNKSLMYTMSGVALLLLLFFLNQSQQSKYNLSSNLIFNGDSELIHRIIMNGSKGDTLELVKTDTTWTMTQADTLILKDRQFNQLFDRLIGGKYDMIISNNIQKWSKFGVTDLEIRDRIILTIMFVYMTKKRYIAPLKMCTIS